MRPSRRSWDRRASTIDDDLYRTSIIGHTNEAIFASLLPHLPAEEHETYADRKEAAFRRLAQELKPLEGLVELLDWADNHGVRVALVTNAPLLNATHILDILGITDRFEVKVTIEQVERGKPDPLPYLTALERLGITAEEAVAFEDSPSGMRAAKAAGLFSFGVLTGLTRRRDAGDRRRWRHRDLPRPGALGDPGAQGRLPKLRRVADGRPQSRHHLHRSVAVPPESRPDSGWPTRPSPAQS